MGKDENVQMSEADSRIRPRRRGLLVVLGVLAAVVFGAAAWYLGSPLFIRTTLVEESPLARAAATGVREARTGAVAPAGEAPPPVGESPSSQPRVLARGRFSDRDQVHRGSGEAILARLPDGTLLLRFEEFSVTNGPDLHVLLSRTERPDTHDQVYDGVYVDKLRASQGAFHYELPSGTDLSGIRSVVVYCVPFRVVFSSAALSFS